MKLSSKELWEFDMNMHQKRQKGLSGCFLSTLAHMRLCHALSTYARSRGEFHFMTHLKYQHLNVDIQFVGLAAAAIPFYKVKEKFKANLVINRMKRCVWWPDAKDRLWGERHFSTTTVQGQWMSTVPRCAFPLLLN